MSDLPPRTGEGVEAALTDAELSLTAIRRQRRTLSIFVVAGVAADLVLLAGVVPTLLRTGDGAVGLSLVVAAAALAAAGGVLLRTVTRRRAIRQQEAVMLRTVNWVREVTPLVAARERWDAERSRAVQARLRRFSIAAR